MKDGYLFAALFCFYKYYHPLSPRIAYGLDRCCTGSTVLLLDGNIYIRQMIHLQKLIAVPAVYINVEVV